MPDAPSLRLADVSYRYRGRDVPAVERVSLTVPRASFTALLGPNGAGKSTIARLAAGTLRPDRGRIELHGRPIHEWPRTELARRLAVVAQEAPPGGIPLTVEAYVELGRNPYVSPWAALGPADRAVVEAALGSTDLEALRDRPLSALSGGERQRAKVARALAQEPDVLLLDEPTVHLDLRHALWVFSRIRQLSVEESVTVVCITHDMNLASRFADRVALVGGGRLLAHGPPGEVLEPGPLAAAFGCELHVERSDGLGLFVAPVGTTAATGRA